MKKNLMYVILGLLFLSLTSSFVSNNEIFIFVSIGLGWYASSLIKAKYNLSFQENMLKAYMILLVHMGVVVLLAVFFSELIK